MKSVIQAEELSIRETDLISQTDYGRRVEPNLDASRDDIKRGTFYETQMTNLVDKESAAFDLSNANKFVALLGGSQSGNQEAMLL